MPSWISPAAPPETPTVSAEPSILAEYLLFPFYDYVVQFYPQSWMPNKVTLVGIFSTVFSSVLLLGSMPAGLQFQPGRMELLPSSLVKDPAIPKVPPLALTEMTPILPFMSPSLMLVLCGSLNLIYCVADNTDGRLARRDKKTSAIGEYLDHGLDCVTSLLSTCCVFLLLASLCNMTISVCLVAFVTVLSHTLHFEANIFIWGNRIATVDEAMLFFGLSMWWPLVCPGVSTTRVPEWIIEGIFGSNSSWATYLRPLRMVELVYIFYSIAQAQTIFRMVSLRWRILCRIHVIFSVLNSLVFLMLMGVHSEYVAAAAPLTSVPGYTLGPFTYPAVWSITVACTSSTIIHIPIIARCARLPVTDPLPLAGIMLVWLIFISCPVAGAILSVVLHVGQMLLNVDFIKKHAQNNNAE
ncbi:putative CDP-alcohol phosphatidyltransferase [Leishmania utingensis]|uniref:CDP-alcohol phosphatidyltransferase n=1 Tax=Leishmania utingensis TaxID=653362 RepID=A0AAW3APW8_9TRYP